MDKLDNQLTQVVVIQRQIPPLAQKMLDTLETFISLDTPFREEERRGRVDLVRSSLAKPKGNCFRTSKTGIRGLQH